MSGKPENPRAFPRAGQAGMTLRDYFAGQAMQGLIASDHEQVRSEDKVAQWAYDQADEMLRARGANCNKEAGQ